MSNLLLLGCGHGGGNTPPGPSGAFVSSNSDGSSNTTHTFVAQNLGAAAADRLSVVSIGWADTTLAGTSELSAVTINGVSATRAIRAQGDNQFLNAEIWYAATPTGSTGDVVVTNTGAAKTRVTIAVYKLTGLAGSTPVDTGIGTTTANVDVIPADIVVAVGVRANTTAHTLSNLTTDFGSTTSSVSTYYGVHSSKVSAATETLTTTISQTGNGPQIAMAAWR